MSEQEEDLDPIARQERDEAYAAELEIYYRLPTEPKDLGKKCVSRLKRLEGDELEAELRELMKIAGDAGESMGFLGSRRLRAGFLIIENSVRLPRDKQTQLIAELEGIIPEGSRSRNFHIALAQWHNNELRLDLKSQLEILADSTIPQLWQEAVLQSVLTTEIELGQMIVDVIKAWRPKEMPSEKTLLAILDRIEARRKLAGHSDIQEEHIEAFFNDWSSWFAWYFQTLLHGDRFSKSTFVYSYWYFIQYKLEGCEQHLKCLAFQFMYECIMAAKLDEKVQVEYLEKLMWQSKDEEFVGFATRLQETHDLKDKPEYKPQRFVLS